MAVILKKRSLLNIYDDNKAPAPLERVADALIFLGFLILSGIAIVAVAVATPVVLAISAIAGLLSKNADRAGWRAAGA